MQHNSNLGFLASVGLYCAYTKLWLNAGMAADRLLHVVVKLQGTDEQLCYTKAATLAAQVFEICNVGAKCQKADCRMPMAWTWLLTVLSFQLVFISSLQLSQWVCHLFQLPYWVQAPRLQGCMVFELDACVLLMPMAQLLKWYQLKVPISH